MKARHLWPLALAGALLVGGCSQHEEDREEETELERNPPAGGTTSFDSAAAGTAIDTTRPLDPDSASLMGAGAADSAHAGH